MEQKFFNDAVIGNKKIKATFSKKGEMLRAYYPSVDFKQLFNFFHVGIKVNDSSIIYLHEDINNKYFQYYTNQTNILNTEIENTYFKLNIRQTDFAMLNEDVMIKKYTMVNNNKVDLDINFLIDSSLVTDENNMVSGKIIENGIIQYSHDTSLAIFSNYKINGHRINDTQNYIKSGILYDKDYIGMSNNSAISYNLGVLKPKQQIEFNIFILIKSNDELKNAESLNHQIDKIKNVDVQKELNKTKKYWKMYLQKHDGLNIESQEVDEKIKQIYERTILLLPLLQNEESGGISSAIEVDEKRQKSGRYSYCWPRDAIFITKALDILQMNKETEKFYSSFCKNTQSKEGMWEQRFYTDGRLAPCWGEQIDETASVVYGINEHYKNTKNEQFLVNNLKMCENATNYIINYLSNIFKEEEKDIVKKEIIEAKKDDETTYKHESYDLWEMNEGIHLYSLASIYSSLQSMKNIYENVKQKYENNRLKYEKITKNIERINEKTKEIKEYIFDNLYDEKTKILKRNLKDSKMDISILGTVYPFEIFMPQEKHIINTVEKMNLTLRTYTGGYLRFEQDTYMGGKNPWVIATLWMAMYYIKCGKEKEAKECFKFATNTASEHGFLAEQIDNNTMKPSWVIGLGWSHALYIIVLSEILKK